MTALRQRLTEMFGFRHSAVQRALPSYVDGSLSAMDRARVSVHLSTCQDCLRRVAELRQLDLLLDNLPTPGETPFTQFWPAIARRTAPRPLRRPVALGVRRPVVALALAVAAVGLGVLAAAALGGGGEISLPHLLPPSNPSAGPSPAAIQTGNPVTARPTTSASSNPHTTTSPHAGPTSQLPGQVSPTASAATPEASRSATPSASPSESPTPSASPTESPSPSPSESPSPSPSPSSSSSSGDGSGSSSPSPSPSPSGSH